MTERQPPAFAGEGSGEARDVVLIVDAIDAHRPSPAGGSPGTGEGSSRLRSEGSGIVSPTVDQNILDLAGVAGAVEFDGDLADAGLGQRREQDVLVAGADVAGWCGGGRLDRVGHGALPGLVLVG